MIYKISVLYMDKGLGYQSFDFLADSCYKIDTSPLLLRVQGARRLITASASLNRWVS